jgi:hypothetical protein
MILFPSACPAWLGRVARFLLRQGTRRVLAWLALLASTAIAVHYAWTCYDEPARRDGNYGHATIDFGGQWLMGRMVVTGNGRSLYNRIVQRSVLEAAYPRADSEDPRLARLAAGHLAPLAAAEPFGAATLLLAAPKPDAGDPQRILDWMMGEDSPEIAAQVGGYLGPLAATGPLDAGALVAAGQEKWRPVSGPLLGGPLYPPINALLCAPLAVLPPRPAYRVLMACNLALTFAIGWLAQRMSGGRIWWQLGAVFVMGFPGYSGALNLGQNALFSLFLLVLGWIQLQRGHPGRAGILWGLLAYKPVWALAFFLVPLLTRRWRMAAAMAATGTTLAAATLPVVGVQAWHDWLQIGSAASALYTRCEPWIFLSRDLISVPRRYLLTFDEGYASIKDPGAQLATAIGLSLWLAPLAYTLAAVIRRGRQATRPTSGPQAAFLLLGSWMACYHFMYYDSLLAYLPCCLLYAEPRRVWRRVAHGMPPGTWRGLLRSTVATGLLIAVSAFPYINTVYDPSYHFPPWETLCLFLLWLWCDLAHGQISRHAAQPGKRGPGVGGPHERLADEDRAHAIRQQVLDICPAPDTAFTHETDARRDGGGDL